ncbi:MAG: hypothetical protein JKY49_02025 [Cohaesibacteraceae bacterium]|nr:hypothetical protein [Cohaesibacteraceae bacterium]MBL4876267.1 hypothetical protein [Cohaesibacteraceae bacterium]
MQNTSTRFPYSGGSIGIIDTDNNNVASPSDIKAIYLLLANAKITQTPEGGLIVYSKLPLEAAMLLEGLRSDLEDMEPIDEE